MVLGAEIGFTVIPTVGLEILRRRRTIPTDRRGSSTGKPDSRFFFSLCDTLVTGVLSGSDLTLA